MKVIRGPWGSSPKVAPKRVLEDQEATAPLGSCVFVPDNSAVLTDQNAHLGQLVPIKRQEK